MFILGISKRKKYNVSFQSQAQWTLESNHKGGILHRNPLHHKQIKQLKCGQGYESVLKGIMRLIRLS